VNTYLSGKSVEITASFFDPVTRLALTPTTIKLRVIDPTGAETDTTGFTVDTTGRYSTSVVVTRPGVWKYRWEVTAPFTDASEGSFTVAATTFPAD
jgi:hypothetical protein